MCLQTKEIGDFYVSKGLPLARCKECTKAKSREHRRFDPVTSGVKTCNKCTKELSVLEFSPVKSCKDGRRSICNSCSRRSAQEWYFGNWERARSNSRRWFSLNERKKTSPVETGEKTCSRCKETKEVGDFYADKYSRDGRGYFCSSCAISVSRMAGKAYRKTEAGRAKHVEHQNRRRALKSGAEVNKIDSGTWASLQNRSCIYCNSENGGTVDHVEPLSRGGKHAPDNLAPCCKPCNSSKGRKLLLEWAVYNPQAFLNRVSPWR